MRWRRAIYFLAVSRVNRLMTRDDVLSQPMRKDDE
jgi:hypothetical protein